jgi:integrase
MTIKVTLRKKKINKGKMSLYLDFWPPIEHPEKETKTRREFLKMYVYDEPKTKPQRDHNREMMRIANQIRNRREVELNKPEIYSDLENEIRASKQKKLQSLIEYYKMLAERKRGRNRGVWLAAVKYLEDYAPGGDVVFKDVDNDFIEGFRNYLLNAYSLKSPKLKLSLNSAYSYFGKVCAALNQAYKNGFLSDNVAGGIKPISRPQTKKEYLMPDEIKKLNETPCDDPTLKRAAMFSVFTGLRYSDVEKMTWRELEYIPEQGYSINFIQQKTQEAEELPISETAYKFTGGRKDPRKMPDQDERVFKGLKYSPAQNAILKKWIKDADINKNITFHSFRHTYATLQVYFGTDLYTVSKMLGHKSIETTKIYAKIADEMKRKAANKMDFLTND